MLTQSSLKKEASLYNPRNASLRKCLSMALDNPNASQKIHPHWTVLLKTPANSVESQDNTPKKKQRKGSRCQAQTTEFTVWCQNETLDGISASNKQKNHITCIENPSQTIPFRIFLSTRFKGLISPLCSSSWLMHHHHCDDDQTSLHQLQLTHSPCTCGSFPYNTAAASTHVSLLPQ